MGRSPRGPVGASDVAGLLLAVGADGERERRRDEEDEHHVDGDGIRRTWRSVMACSRTAKWGQLGWADLRQATPGVPSCPTLLPRITSSLPPLWHGQVRPWLLVAILGVRVSSAAVLRYTAVVVRCLWPRDRLSAQADPGAEAADRGRVPQNMGRDYRKWRTVPVLGRRETGAEPDARDDVADRADLDPNVVRSSKCFVRSANSSGDSTISRRQGPLPRGSVPLLRRRGACPRGSIWLSFTYRSLLPPAS